MTQTTNHPPPELMRDEPFCYRLVVTESLPNGGWFAGRSTHEWDRKKKQWVKL